MLPTPIKRSYNILPLAHFSVMAGFPNPCEDFLEAPVSLDSIMIDNPSSTFLFRVNGKSMEPLIQDNSILIVDKSITVKSGCIVLATIDGNFVVKELSIDLGRAVAKFTSHNSEHPTIELPIDPENNWEAATIWGVVTGVMSKL